MNRITAVIRPQKLKEVTDALLEAGAEGVTVTEVRGCGRQKGHTETYRGAEYEVNLLPKVMVDVIVPEDLTQKIVDAISENAKTGQIGDGRIFVQPVSSTVRIRTGEDS